MNEYNFHKKWRPDWDEIENPINNDRRVDNNEKEKKDECVEKTSRWKTLYQI